MKNVRLILAGILISLSGCQTVQPLQTAPIDNGNFMSLWTTYAHCQASTDSNQLRADALTLTKAVGHVITPMAKPLSSPGKIDNLVPIPAARFAVDVKAMAAACSLRAGSAAMQAGYLDVAKDLLKTVLSYQPQSEYAYYNLRARTLLSEMEATYLEVTLHRP